MGNGRDITSITRTARRAGSRCKEVTAHPFIGTDSVPAIEIADRVGHVRIAQPGSAFASYHYSDVPIEWGRISFWDRNGYVRQGWIVMNPDVITGINMSVFDDDLSEEYGSANLPPFGDALCSEAVSFFTSRGQYYDANGFQPRLGDWIYYKRIGSNDIASHVGIVNDFYNNKIYTVEGNWGSPRCVRVFNDAAAEHSGYTIVGYARPTYA